MCDFLPGYLSLLSNPKVSSIPGNIIIFGFEDGKVYGTFQTNSEFFQRLCKRKSSMRMMCYLKDAEFSQAEMESAWRRNVTVIGPAEYKNIIQSLC